MDETSSRGWTDRGVSYLMKKRSLIKKSSTPSGYTSVLADVAHLLEDARPASVRTANAIMTATYWEVGRRIVEFEQGGKKRAAYGEELLQRLSADLCARFGRGFSIRNLRTFRTFYLSRPIRQTLSAEFKKNASPESTAIIQTPSEQLSIADLAKCFPLPWSHYVLL